MFFKLVLTALLAVGTENILFVGGLGFSRAMRSAQRPGFIGVYALLVTWFTAVSMGTGILLNPLLPSYGMWNVLRASCFAAAAAVAYLVTSLLVRAFFPVRAKKKIASVLTPAAVNTVVLAMPYVQRSFSFDPVQAAGYALGTGAAFYLASVVLMHADAKCRNPDMPAAFHGLPAMLLYIGILSMAFAGFSGMRIF